VNEILACVRSNLDLNVEIQISEPLSNLDSKPEVTLYSVDWCGWCHLARAWLEEHAVSYQEIEVPDLQQERHEVLKISGQLEVPVIVVECDSRHHVFLDEHNPELRHVLGVAE
jgi:glutaredoxin